MTTPRLWPNEAAEVRNQAAELAHQASETLRPILESRKLTDPESIRQIGSATVKIERVARLLEHCGATTSPLSYVKV